MVQMLPPLAPEAPSEGEQVAEEGGNSVAVPEPGDQETVPQPERGLKEWAIGSGWRWTKLLPCDCVLRDRKGWNRVLTDLENCPHHPCGDCHIDRSFQKPRMSQDLELPLRSAAVKNHAGGAPPSLFPLCDSNTTGGARSWTQRKRRPRAETLPSLILKCSSRGQSQIDQEPTQLTRNQRISPCWQRIS